MPTLQTLQLVDGVLKVIAGGGATVPRLPTDDDFAWSPGAGFVATSTNTGVLAGVTRTAYTGSTTINGSSDPANPTLIENRNITSLLTIQSGFVTFRNCLFSAGPGTFNTGQVDCRPANVRRVRFERCTFNPTNPSYFLNAVIGHHMSLVRCFITRVVDAVGSYNQYGARTDNYLDASYVERLVRYDVDADHTDGTHNDLVQHQGGEGLWVRENTAYGYNFYADGTRPPTTDVYYRTAQCVLVQQNVAVNGVYYCGDVHVLDNRIYGFQHPLVFKARSSGGVPYDVECKRNLWMNSDQRDYGGTLRFYNIRLGSITTLNGISYPTSGGTDDSSGNAYSTELDVLTTFRSAPVKVRRDPNPV